eukprot:IDg4830t1
MSRISIGRPAILMAGPGVKALCGQAQNAALRNRVTSWMQFT